MAHQPKTGKAGSFRVNALDRAALAAMQTHGKRLDLAGHRRAIRDTPPLIYDPYRCHLDLMQAYDLHADGTRRSRSAKKLVLHGFFQFPTQLEIQIEADEERMLSGAVKFVNKHHGGEAVFHGRLDRDEQGRHGVDVFYAPKFEKRPGEVWISLSKFGRKLARDRLGKREKQIKNPKTGEWERVLNDKGEPVLIWQDSSFFVGRVLQDALYEYLLKDFGLDWVERGSRKISRDQDRLEVEAYKTSLEVTRQAELEQQISEMNVKHKALEVEIRTNEHLAATAKQNAIDQTAAAEHQSKIAKECQEAAQQAERRLQELRGSLADLEEQKQELEETQQTIETKRAELDGLSAQVEELRDELVQRSRERNDLETAIEELSSLVTDLRLSVRLSESGYHNFEDAMAEVAGVMEASANLGLTDDILANAKRRAFFDEQNKPRRFAEDASRNQQIVEFVAVSFDNAIALFHRLKSITNLNDEVERAMQLPSALMRMQNEKDAFQEAVAETLKDLGLERHRVDVKDEERDPNGDLPLVHELIISRADRKLAMKDAALAATMSMIEPST